MKSLRRGGLCACLVLVSLAGRALAGDHDSSASILARAAATGKARTFVTAVYLGGLLETLRDGGPFTVFVPTDQAFNNLPESDLIALLQPANQKKLAKILTYHVVKGRILASQITNKPRLKTVEGGFINIAANAKGVAVNDATVVQTDLIGRNGVVHLIDRVLSPPAEDILETAKRTGSFKLLLKALEVTGLDEALESDGPFTVFAPSDEAFLKLGKSTIEELLNDHPKLTAILKYHVVPGDFSAGDLIRRKIPNNLLGRQLSFTNPGGKGLSVNGIKAARTDLKTRNGTIHVIEGVLMPSGARNIITTAEQAGQFKILLKALEVADLSETLREKGPFTVLAPTDEAFEKLGERTIAALLKDKEKLTEILKLHVIPSVSKAQDLAAGAGLKTLQGETLKSFIVKGRLVLNESNVLDTDIDAGNGIIQVIDRVLIPSDGKKSH